MSRDNGRGKHYKQGNMTGRTFAGVIGSISILALIIVLCLWVPLAMAEAGVETSSGSDAATAMTAEQTATAAPEATGDASIETSTAAEDTATPAVQDVDADPAENGGRAPSTEDSDAAEAATSPLAAPATSASTTTEQPAEVAVAADSGADDCDAAAGTQYGAGCEPEYKLDLFCSWGENGTYWDSVDDYQAGLLSILYHLENNGTGTAYNLNITSATATNGVTVATDFASIVLGDLGPGEAINFILKWLVPQQVRHYDTTIEICADCEQPVCPDGECSPPDPCIENPELCQPVDPCIEDPTLCNPIDPGDIGPTPTVTPAAAPTLVTRAALPSTGMGMLPAAIAALALLALGAIVPLSIRWRRNEN